MREPELLGQTVVDLDGDERGPFEIEDPVDDVADLAEPANWLEAGDALVRRPSQNWPRWCRPSDTTFTQVASCARSGGHRLVTVWVVRCF
jgi:hypothetical protein